MKLLEAKTTDKLIPAATMIRYFTKFNKFDPIVRPGYDALLIVTTNLNNNKSGGFSGLFEVLNYLTPWGYLSRVGILSLSPLSVFTLVVFDAITGTTPEFSKFTIANFHRTTTFTTARRSYSAEQIRDQLEPYLGAVLKLKRPVPNENSASLVSTTSTSAATPNSLV